MLMCYWSYGSTAQPLTIKLFLQVIPVPDGAVLFATLSIPLLFPAVFTSQSILSISVSLKLKYLIVISFNVPQLLDV